MGTTYDTEKIREAARQVGKVSERLDQDVLFQLKRARESMDGLQGKTAEALDQILNLGNVPGMNKAMLLDAFEFYGTQIYTGTRLKSVLEDGAIVELPDGTRFVAYQNLAPAGNLYKTEDGEWEFFESGAGCIVARLDKDRSGYVTRFRGTLCATVRNPANATRERIRSGGSTPHGFGRDANGPRDVTNETN